METEAADGVDGDEGKMRWGEEGEGGGGEKKERRRQIVRRGERRGRLPVRMGRGFVNLRGWRRI